MANKGEVRADLLLGGKDEAIAGVRQLARELEGLSSTAGGVAKALTSAGTGAASGLGAANKEVGALDGGLTKLRGGLQSVLGAAGLGRYGALVGLVGATAAIGAAVGLVAKGTQMALEMEKSADNVARQLSIGAGSITAAMTQIRQTSHFVAKERFGYTQREVIEGVGVYGAAAGLTAPQALAGADPLARYARAMGFRNPADLAGPLGAITAYTGGGAAGNLSTLFGGAEGAGSLGRRTPEYLDQILRVLQATRAQSAGAAFSVDTATREVVAIAKAGGYYATPQGQAVAQGGLLALTAGGKNDPFKAHEMMRAGISPFDIVSSNPGSANENTLKMARQFEKDFGTLRSGNTYQMIQLQRLVGDAQGTALFNIATKRYGGHLSALTGSDLGGLATDPTQRLNEALGTTAGRYERASKDLEQILTDLGDVTLTKLVVPAIEKLDDGINRFDKDWLQGVQGILGGDSALEAALFIAAGTIGGGNALGMLRGMGGAVPAAARTALGFAPELVGAAALPVAAGLGVVAMGYGLWKEASRAYSITDQVKERAALARRYSGSIASDIADGTMTNFNLVHGLAMESGLGLGFSVINSGHGPDNAWGGHKIGLAADIVSVQGHPINDPKYGLLAYARMMANPMTKRLGVDDFYTQNYRKQLEAAWVSTGRNPADLFHDQGTGPHLHQRFAEEGIDPAVRHIYKKVIEHDLDVHVTVTQRPKQRNHASPGSRQPLARPGHYGGR